MPSVGMRRTTRVFGVVKGADRARVLRSGRHLWPESADNKQRKGGDREECYSFVESKGSGSKQIGWTKNVNSKRRADVAKVRSSEDHVMAEVKAEAPAEAEGDDGRVDKMYGIVYFRKRKRKASDSRNLEEKMYGIHFTRRQKRKKMTLKVSQGFKGLAVVAPSASSSDKSAFSSFLFSIWTYMTRARLRLSDLSRFLSAEPISSIYAKNGFHFLWDPPSISGSGVCKFFETRQSLPMFVVNFSAVPKCFLLMHVNMLLSHHALPSAPVNNSTDEQLYGEEMCGSDDDDDNRSPFPSECDMAEAVEGRLVQQQQLPPRLSKSDGRAAQHRYGVRSRSIRKRRRSLRSRRGRNPSVLGLNRKNGALASDLVTAKRSGYPFSSVVPGKKVRQSVRRRQARTVHEIAPAILGNPDITDSSACAANILVAESDDQCFREQGANIVLNKQASLVAAAAAATKIIPVPRVTEVSDYDDLNFANFSRLETYITVNADEVARAMAKTTANYDIDFEDEEWLKKFNIEQPAECVTEDAFELMIDAFEKAFFYNPHDFSQENPDADICSDICKREVVEAVYSYWMKKRKQRRSALVSVFQAHQPKRAPLVPRPALRKKRSFKRQPSSHQGRGKHQSVLQALEEHDMLRRLEEAKMNAKRALEEAVEKRKRAQFLAGNADLASYRAMMALRIAEAAAIAESPDSELVSELLLDLEQQQTGAVCDQKLKRRPE